jgi:hypothetical protein
MAAFTDYLENKLIDHVLRGVPYSAPANVYAALVTSTQDDASAGTEVSSGSYARVAVPSSVSSWSGTQGQGTTTASTGSSGSTSNNIAFTFPTPTADWGTIVGVAFYDAPIGGNRLMYSALTSQKTILNGDPAPSFPVNAVLLQLDN